MSKRHFLKRSILGVAILDSSKGLTQDFGAKLASLLLIVFLSI